MPTTPVIVTSSEYRRLLTAIRREMERGLQKVQELLDRQKVVSYWVIGKKINAYLTRQLLPRGAAGPFYRRLSGDLGINGRTLQHCEQFYRYFPDLKNGKRLNWSHYRFLLKEPSAKKRRAWITRIQREGISADQLRLYLAAPPAERKKAAAAMKEPVRGRLYTYRLRGAIGVDAPELSTLAGRRAKKWLEDELKDCGDIVVKTYKSDNWDRYLVDVFYIPGETDLGRIAREGAWLNRRMVEAGHAAVWQG